MHKLICLSFVKQVSIVTNQEVYKKKKIKCPTTRELRYMKLKHYDVILLSHKSMRFIQI